MSCILNEKVYNNILWLMGNFRGNLWELEKVIVDHYQLPGKVAHSIVATSFTKHVKYTHGRFKKQAHDIYLRYKSQIARNDNDGIIIRLAEESGASPYLIAKLILEETLLEEARKSKGANKEKPCDSAVGDVSTKTKNNVTLMMRDTTLIPDGRLACEILLCSIHDSQYGPITEFYNRIIGEEHERRLRLEAKAIGLSYQTEDDLRARGYDKTPDLRLDVPIAIDGFVVNWIESKALFGCPVTHEEYISNQYSSYWNRFGPGLVIYWMGYVESIIDPAEKRFLVRSELPKKVNHMKPLSIAASHVQCE